MTISKAIKAVAIIIIAVLGGAVATSWLYPSALISTLASIGGMIVFLGLWLEKEAEEEERGLHNLRDIMLKAKWGWRILMIGIGLEVALGSFTAGLEAWNSWKNDPLNAPINTISAVVKLKVKGVRNVPFNTPGQGIFVQPSEDERPTFGNGGITFVEGTNISKPIYRLSSGLDDIQILASGLVGGSNDWRGVIVSFKEGGFDSWDMRGPFSSNRFRAGPTVRKFNKVGGLVISLPQMETNVTIESGIVEVKVNSSRWEFPVPAQRQRLGYMTSQFVTNAKRQIECKVLPITITDWTYPPRFPKVEFDGK